MSKRWTTLEVLKFYQEHVVSSFRKEVDAAIVEHTNLKAEVRRLREALEDLLDMTLVIDEATIPKVGIEAAPENQVVYNASISHSRIKRARHALKE